VLGNGRETEEEAGEEYGDAEVAIEELKTLSLKGKSNRSSLDPPITGPDHPYLTRFHHSECSNKILRFKLE